MDEMNVLSQYSNFSLFFTRILKFRIPKIPNPTVHYKMHQ